MTTFSGEKAWVLLQNPSSRQIEISELLLLNAIKASEQGARQTEIKRWLREKSGKIRIHNPNFYVAWSTGYKLDEELLRFLDIGLIDVKDVQGGTAIWKVTERGEKILQDRRDLLSGLELET